MSQTIYLVMCGVDFEAGSDPVFAFDDEEAANRFSALCTEYRKKKPKFPDMDGEYEIWDSDNERWEKDHPAQSHTYADIFFVLSVNRGPGKASSPRSES